MSKIIQIKGKSYKIIELLGKGAFGQVFKVQCEHEFLALKVEEIQNNVTETGLLKEKKVYDLLNQKEGFVHMKEYTEDESLRVLLMDLLDRSLDELQQDINLLDVITQITLKLEVLHTNGIIHGDIKPNNVMRHPESKEWHLIDFGLSHFMDDGQNFMFVNSIGGTWLYCSRNMHCRMQSFQNDFESLAFLIIRHINRNLPWEQDCMQINKKNQNDTIKRQMVQNIFKKKVEFIKNIHTLNLPVPFQSFVEECFSMENFVLPNFKHLMDILNEIN